MSQQTELALVHRLMHDLDSMVLPGHARIVGVGAKHKTALHH
jgi:hypothetical protein